MFQLGRAKPNGTINHGLPGLKNVFNIRIKLYEMGAYPRDETIEGFRKRKGLDYRYTGESILEAVNKYNAKI